MTRKKYIKLLMSNGMPIREARIRAIMDVSIYRSYSDAFLLQSKIMNDIFREALIHAVGFDLAGMVENTYGYRNYIFS